jgi:hypothetical protein
VGKVMPEDQPMLVISTKASNERAGLGGGVPRRTSCGQPVRHPCAWRKGRARLLD